MNVDNWLVQYKDHHGIWVSSPGNYRGDEEGARSDAAIYRKFYVHVRIGKRLTTTTWETVA